MGLFSRNNNNEIRVITASEIVDAWGFARERRGEGPTCCGEPMEHAGDGYWGCVVNPAHKTDA